MNDSNQSLIPAKTGRFYDYACGINPERGVRVLVLNDDLGVPMAPTEDSIRRAQETALEYIVACVEECGPCKKGCELQAFEAADPKDLIAVYTRQAVTS